MTNREPLRKLFWRPAALVLLAIMFGVYFVYPASSKQDDKIGVALIGVHHLGSSYNISQFYVDGYSGMNVGREGGGGGIICCVILPRRWREGLMVEVRWSINDWSKENRVEMDAGNYESLQWGGAYRAKVPVEKYDEPGDIYVHFFPNGRVRVVSSNAGMGSTLHPIQRGDPHAVDSATSGVAITQLFTDEELAEMERKQQANRGWR